MKILSARKFVTVVRTSSQQQYKSEIYNKALIRFELNVKGLYILRFAIFWGVRMNVNFK